MITKADMRQDYTLPTSSLFRRSKTAFYVVLDMEQHMLAELDLDTLPLEICPVRRGQDGNL